MTRYEKICEAFGFKVEVISIKDFEIHGETRKRITVKRPNGKKFYHAIEYANGFIGVCG